MPSSPVSGVDRRLFLTSLLGGAAGVAGLSGCAQDSAAAAGKGASTAPLADKVPAGTSLKIASYQNVQQLQFKLALHGDKTRLIEFGKLVAEHRRRRNTRRPETFAFLGFTHYCGWSRD